MIDATELERRIRDGIPLSRHMDFRVRRLSANRIEVGGGAQENRNVHDTAFAGSLYAICTLALWGLVNSHLPKDTTLVLSDAQIRYRAPVPGDIVAHCSIADSDLERFLDQLHRDGRARLHGQVQVDNGHTSRAVVYEGTVHARRGRKDA